MSLVNELNKYCPNTNNGHSHRTAYKSNNRNECLLCKDNNQRKTFMMLCNNNIDNTKGKTWLNNKTIFVLKLIFNMENNYLPLELQQYIFNNCINYTNNILSLKLNKIDLKHLCSCKHCVLPFFGYLERNVCSNHLIPRINHYPYINCYE